LNALWSLYPPDSKSSIGLLSAFDLHTLLPGAAVDAPRNLVCLHKERFADLLRGGDLHREQDGEPPTMRLHFWYRHVLLKLHPSDYSHSLLLCGINFGAHFAHVASTPRLRQPIARNLVSAPEHPLLVTTRVSPHR
jgi:hypothetical protein